MIQNDSVLYQKYVDNLVDRLFKILPLYEEKNEGLFSNIQSLIYELDGLQYVVENCLDYDYIMLLATLESLSDEALDYNKENQIIVKREVFKCINIAKKMGEKATGGGEQ